MKAWGGRFGGPPDEASLAFGRSIDVDAELALDDITGPIAHVHGLERAGLPTGAETEPRVAGATAPLAGPPPGAPASRPGLPERAT